MRLLIVIGALALVTVLGVQTKLHERLCFGGDETLLGATSRLFHDTFGRPEDLDIQEASLSEGPEQPAEGSEKPDALGVTETTLSPDARDDSQSRAKQRLEDARKNFAKAEDLLQRGWTGEAVPVTRY